MCPGGLRVGKQRLFAVRISYEKEKDFGFREYNSRIFCLNLHTEI